MAFVRVTGKRGITSNLVAIAMLSYFIYWVYTMICIPVVNSHEKFVEDYELYSEYTEARVVSVTEETVKVSKDGSSGKSTMFRYDYETEYHTVYNFEYNGETYQFEGTSSTKPAIGSKTEIKFNPKNPNMFVKAGVTIENHKVGVYAVYGFILVFGLIDAYIILCTVINIITSIKEAKSKQSS